MERTEKTMENCERIVTAAEEGRGRSTSDDHEASPFTSSPAAATTLTAVASSRRQSRCSCKTFMTKRRKRKQQGGYTEGGSDDQGCQSDGTQTRQQDRLDRRQLRRRLESPVSALLLLALLALSDLLLLPVSAYISRDLVVETNKGKIRGVTLKAATNK